VRLSDVDAAPPKILDNILEMQLIAA